MVIMILFHSSGYRCLKHFYLEKVCKHMRHLFPEVVSYNRFVELEREIAIPLILFIKKVLLGKCTGISFVDSTPLRVCKNQITSKTKLRTGSLKPQNLKTSKPQNVSDKREQRKLALLCRAQGTKAQPTSPAKRPYNFTKHPTK